MTADFMIEEFLSFSTTIPILKKNKTLIYLQKILINGWFLALSW